MLCLHIIQFQPFHSCIHCSKPVVTVAKSIYLFFHQWVTVYDTKSGRSSQEFLKEDDVETFTIFPAFRHNGVNSRALCFIFQPECLSSQSQSTHNTWRTHHKKAVVTCSNLPIESDFEQVNFFPVLVQLLYPPQ